jgi:hypothetical protein
MRSAPRGGAQAILKAERAKERASYLFQGASIPPPTRRESSFWPQTRPCFMRRFPWPPEGVGARNAPTDFDGLRRVEQGTWERKKEREESNKTRHIVLALDAHYMVHEPYMRQHGRPATQNTRYFLSNASRCRGCLTAAWPVPEFQRLCRAEKPQGRRCGARPEAARKPFSKRSAPRSAPVIYFKELPSRRRRGERVLFGRRRGLASCAAFRGLLKVSGRGTPQQISTACGASNKEHGKGRKKGKKAIKLGI